MRHKITDDQAKMDAQLLFDELGFALDDEQYRDIISVMDLFHFYTRQYQYRKFRPSIEQLEENKPRALLLFAGRAILNEVHEKHRVWSWDYFKERRDDRKEYVELFKVQSQRTAQANQQQAGVQAAQSDENSRMRELERKLSYKDIRFYRSIARQELRKERAAIKKDEIANGTAEKRQSGGGGWLGWLWGGGGSNQHGEGNESGMLNDEQRKELYDAIEWDESNNNEVANAVDLPREAMKLRLTTKLQTGSFALRDHSRGSDIISLIFDSLQADMLQRVDNLEAALTLGGLRVYDGTTRNSLYPQIVRVKSDELGLPERENSTGSTLKEMEEQVHAESDPENPFFYLKFENKPLDNRADNALTLKMRSMEVIYHRGYVESIIQFFKPPESELELIGALIDVASETLEGIRKETRAGLENALQNHKTIDMVVDVKAPIIIVPEDVTVKRCQHIVLDAGHIAVRSVLADQGALDTIKSKQHKQYDEEDYRQLEELMYDRFFVKLESAQLVMGNDLLSCLRGLASDSTDHGLHLLERINLDFTIHNSILPKAPNLTKLKVTGHLPTLRVNFSDRKYKTLMRIIDVAIPNFGDETPTPDVQATVIQMPEEEKAEKADGSTALDLNKERRQRLAGQLRGEEYLIEQDDEEKDDFQDAEDVTADVSQVALILQRK